MAIIKRGKIISGGEVEYERLWNAFTSVLASVCPRRSLSKVLECSVGCSLICFNSIEPGSTKTPSVRKPSIPSIIEVHARARTGKNPSLSLTHMHDLECYSQFSLCLNMMCMFASGWCVAHFHVKELHGQAFLACAISFRACLWRYWSCKCATHHPYQNFFYPHANFECKWNLQYSRSCTEVGGDI